MKLCNQIVTQTPQPITQAARIIIDVAKTFALLFDKYFLLPDRRNSRILSVLPEGNQEPLDFGGAGNLDCFLLESDHVANVVSLAVAAAKQLQPARQRDLLFRV